MTEPLDLSQQSTTFGNQNWESHWITPAEFEQMLKTGLFTKSKSKLCHLSCSKISNTHMLSYFLESQSRADERDLLLLRVVLSETNEICSTTQAWPRAQIFESEITRDFQVQFR